MAREETLPQTQLDAENRRHVCQEGSKAAENVL